MSAEIIELERQWRVEAAKAQARAKALRGFAALTRMAGRSHVEAKLYDDAAWELECISGIRVHKKRDGYLMIPPNGQGAFMTLFEGLRYRFTKKLPKRADQLISNMFKDPETVRALMTPLPEELQASPTA